jgi:hypothetical protein
MRPAFLLGLKIAKIRPVMVMKQEPRNEREGTFAFTFPQRTYDEIVDLFARGASPEEILSFHTSPETQERVRELRFRNSEGELTEDEAAELECFSELEHLMRHVKARAHKYIKKT